MHLNYLRSSLQQSNICSMSKSFVPEVVHSRRKFQLESGEAKAPEKEVLIEGLQRDADEVCTLNNLKSSSREPNICSMSQSSVLKLVYGRGKFQLKSGEERAPEKEVLIKGKQRDAHEVCSLNYRKGSSYESNNCSMSQSFVPKLVYKRRKSQPGAGEERAPEKEVLIERPQRDADEVCTLNYLESSSQQSSICSMPKSSEPIVYSRRKFRGHSTAISKQAQLGAYQNDNHLVSSNSPAAAEVPHIASQIEHACDNSGASVMPSVSCMQASELMCAESNERSGRERAVPIREEKRNADDFCCLNYLRSSLQQSNRCAISKSFVPIVYTRRKFQGHSTAVLKHSQPDTYQTDNSLSVVSSNSPAAGEESLEASQVEHEPHGSGVSVTPSLVLVRANEEMCAESNEQSRPERAESIREEQRNADKLCTLNDLTNSSEQSKVCNMPKASVPIAVYSRRKFKGQPAAILKPAQMDTMQTDNHLSIVSSNIPAAIQKLHIASQADHESGYSGASIKPSLLSMQANKEMHAESNDQIGPNMAVSIRGEKNNADEACALSDLRSSSQQLSLCTIREEKRNADEACALNNLGNNSQQSNVCTISKSSVPKLFYSRRKSPGHSNDISEKAQLDTNQTDNYLSVVSSNNPAAVKELDGASQIEHVLDDSGASVMPSLLRCRDAEYFNGFTGKIQGLSGLLKSSNKIKEVNSLDDRCSSSKKALELVLASLPAEVDGNGEASLSTAVSMEGMEKKLSEKELSIYVCRSVGLPARVRPNRRNHTTNSNYSDCGRTCSQLCKICGKPDTTLNMLLCDDCEEAFHMSCCKSHLKKVTDKWFCSSCHKKKHKISKKTNGKSGNESQKDESDTIALMLEDMEPYTSSVRVGKGYQADIPDWSGPIYSNVDSVGKPLEINSPECLHLHNSTSSMNCKFCAISNWLQCQEIDAVSGKPCRKWRRAPISEVQTKNWECFCCVFWDSAHADCAVPQELETEEILKQLKYVKMLRKRRAPSKRQKLHSAATGNGKRVKKDHTNAK